MYGRLIYVWVLCFCVMINVSGTNYYVSVSGSDSNNGTTILTPFASITKGISMARAGDAVYVRGGEYKYSAKISLSRNGTPESPIKMEAYLNEKPIIDFSTMATNSSNRGFSLSGNYWIIKGLKIQKAGDNGMNISGSYNTIENCVFFANRDTGLQLGGGAGNNNIINCDSYGNADPTDYADADGFACKIDVGDNNYFYGCRAWLNVDDGWDGYMKEDVKPTTTLENCWTWMNGYFLDGSDGGDAANGNGFKVGGSDTKAMDHNFTLINCVAFDNKSKGFDQNNNTGDMHFYNCTSFRNKGKNYSIPRALSTGRQAVVANCISIDGDISLGSFVTQQTNSWNGFTFSNADLASLDTTGVSGARNADGSLPLLDFVNLSEASIFIDAGTDMGYPFYGVGPDLGAFESNYKPTSAGHQSNTKNAIALNIRNSKISSSLSLQLNSDVHSKASLKVMSLSGQVVVDVLIQDVYGNRNLNIDVSDLSLGMYVVIVQSNGYRCSTKFIKSAM